MTVSIIHRQNQMTHIRQTTSTSAQSKNGNVRKRQYQTEIECDHSMGNDKSHCITPQGHSLYSPGI